MLKQLYSSIVMPQIKYTTPVWKSLSKSQIQTLEQIQRAYTDRQTDRYFIDRKEVITDLFVIEMRNIYIHVYTRLLPC